MKPTNPRLRDHDVTLRDLFAAFALAGQIAHPAWPEPARDARCGDEVGAAHWAYAFADAMLAERAKTAAGKCDAEHDEPACGDSECWVVAKIRAGMDEQ